MTIFSPSIYRINEWSFTPRYIKLARLHACAVIYLRRTCLLIREQAAVETVHFSIMQHYFLVLSGEAT